jgi:hypothetical protein
MTLKQRRALKKAKQAGDKLLEAIDLYYQAQQEVKNTGYLFPWEQDKDEKVASIQWYVGEEIYKLANRTRPKEGTR